MENAFIDRIRAHYAGPLGCSCLCTRRLERDVYDCLALMLGGCTSDAGPLTEHEAVILHLFIVDQCTDYVTQCLEYRLNEAERKAEFTRLLSWVFRHLPDIRECSAIDATRFDDTQSVTLTDLGL